MTSESNFDALLPAEMAKKAEGIGVNKANMAALPMLALAILAGAFISLGAIFATTISAGTTGVPFGFVKVAMGVAFALGLILVVVGGAELFTGNNLIIMAYTSHKITFLQLLRNWAIVYLGNFLGSIATVLVMFLTRQYAFGGGVVGLAALNIADGKCALDFVQAIALGMMCNALVCMAVWLCYSARSTTDRIMAIIFPITAFVAAGFEHSVANMYFIPIGLFIKSWGSPAFFETIGKTAADYSHLTWENFFFANLLPVTIGNIIGGAVMVGLMYWFIFNRKKA